jgi:DNA repair exonuclease SbcCD ATPase subunit
MEQQQQIKLELLLSIKDDLFKQKSTLEQLLLDERNYSEELENRIRSMNEEYSASLERSEKSGESFLEKITNLMQESESLQKENLELKLKLKEKEDQIFYLQENKFKFSNFNGIAEEYKKRVEEMTVLYSKCEKERENLQNIVKNSAQINEKLFKSHSKDELEEINKNLLKNLKDFQDELKFYKLQQVELKLENAMIKENNQKLSEMFQEAQSKVNSLESDNSTFNENLQKITDSLQIVEDKLKVSELEKKSALDELRQVQSLKEKLEKEMEEFKCKVMQSVKLERSNIDDVDLALDKYFADQGLENLFVKFSTGLYVYGTKKVNVSLKQGSIVCRVSGAYYLIEEFLKVDYQEKKIVRTVLGSPVNSRNKSFNFNAKHHKTNSLVSHLVSPSNKNRLRLSFDFENQSNEKVNREKVKSFKMNTSL